MKGLVAAIVAITGAALSADATEMEVNPIVIRPTGVTAVDAVVIGEG